MGVKKDDKVLFMMHNRTEFLEANWAVQKCGAIPVPMNYRFKAEEIEFQADHCDAIVFILEDMWLEQVQEAMPNLKKIEHYVCVGDECPSNMTAYESLMENYPAQDPDVPTGEEDVCVIVYTGGTTGFPKGVMHTYGAHLRLFEEAVVNLATRICQTPLTPELRKKVSQLSPLPGAGLALSLLGSRPVQWIMTRPRTTEFFYKLVKESLLDLKKIRLLYAINMRTIFPSFPLFHDASYVFTIFTAVTGNQTLIMTEEVKFDPEKILAMIEKEKPHMMGNVPTGWKMLVDYPDFDKYDVSSVVACVSGASQLTAEVKRKMLNKLNGALILDGFGQTEMTSMSSFRLECSKDNVRERNAFNPMLETRIVDDDGNDVPRGEMGEIIYKSPTTMKGYYKDEEKTAEVIKDGWLYSGDLGYFDENDEIHLVDRKKECINTGGEKVFPQEVEQVIIQHPSVEDVCIIGVPDEKWGSSVSAVVMLKESQDATEEEIIKICEGKLAGYKKPRSVVFVDDFPLSAVGKVLRSKIRELHGKP
jgi:acyl-CoA synthetase (AMP-forming)/AMP-acid ligase II